MSPPSNSTHGTNSAIPDANDATVTNSTNASTKQTSLQITAHPVHQPFIAMLPSLYPSPHSTPTHRFPCHARCSAWLRPRVIVTLIIQVLAKRTDEAKNVQQRKDMDDTSATPGAVRVTAWHALHAALLVEEQRALQGPIAQFNMTQSQELQRSGVPSAAVCPLLPQLFEEILRELHACSMAGVAGTSLSTDAAHQQQQTMEVSQSQSQPMETLDSSSITQPPVASSSPSSPSHTALHEILIAILDFFLRDIHFAMSFSSLGVNAEAIIGKLCECISLSTVTSQRLRASNFSFSHIRDTFLLLAHQQLHWAFFHSFLADILISCQSLIYRISSADCPLETSLELVPPLLHFLGSVWSRGSQFFLFRSVVSGASSSSTHTSSYDVQVVHLYQQCVGSLVRLDWNAKLSARATTALPVWNESHFEDTIKQVHSYAVYLVKIWPYPALFHQFSLPLHLPGLSASPLLSSPTGHLDLSWFSPLEHAASVANSINFSNLRTEPINVASLLLRHTEAMTVELERKALRKSDSSRPLLSELGGKRKSQSSKGAASDVAVDRKTKAGKQQPRTSLPKPPKIETTTYEQPLLPPMQGMLPVAEQEATNHDKQLPFLLPDFPQNGSLLTFNLDSFVSQSSSSARSVHEFLSRLPPSSSSRRSSSDNNNKSYQECVDLFRAELKSLRKKLENAFEHDMQLEAFCNRYKARYFSRTSHEYNRMSSVNSSSLTPNKPLDVNNLPFRPFTRHIVPSTLCKIVDYDTKLIDIANNAEDANDSYERDPDAPEDADNKDAKSKDEKNSTSHDATLTQQYLPLVRGYYASQTQTVDLALLYTPPSKFAAVPLGMDVNPAADRYKHSNATTSMLESLSYTDWTSQIKQTNVGNKKPKWVGYADEGSDSDREKGGTASTIPPALMRGTFSNGNTASSRPLLAESLGFTQPLPVSTVYTPVRSNIPKEDETTLEFVPYFGDEAKPETVIDVNLYSNIVKAPPADEEKEVEKKPLPQTIEKPTVSDTNSVSSESEYACALPTTMASGAIPASDRKRRRTDTDVPEDDTDLLEGMSAYLLRICAKKYGVGTKSDNPSLPPLILRVLSKELGVSRSTILAQMRKDALRTSQTATEPQAASASSGKPNTASTTTAPFEVRCVNPNHILDSYEKLFCRRCYLYDCQKHGPNQPRASVDLLAHTGERIQLKRKIPDATTLKEKQSAQPSKRVKREEESSSKMEYKEELNSSSSSNRPRVSISLSPNGSTTMTPCGAACFLHEKIEIPFSPNAPPKLLSAPVSAAASFLSSFVFNPFSSSRTAAKDVPAAAASSAAAAAEAPSLSSKDSPPREEWSEIEKSLLRQVYFVASSLLNSQQPNANQPTHIPSILHQPLLPACSMHLYCRLAKLMASGRSCADIAHYCEVVEPNMAFHGQEVAAMTSSNTNSFVLPPTSPFTCDTPTSSPSPAPLNRMSKADFQYRLKQISRQYRELAIRFHPCDHEGPCTSDCPCVAQDLFCESSCGCGPSCANRYAGCRCSGSRCQTKACPCFVAQRECEPDLCRNCRNEYELDSTLHREQAPLHDHVHGSATRCDNVSLLSGRKHPLLLSRSDTHGWGCFAGGAVDKDRFLTEYTGELISHEEADRRGKIYDHLNRSYLFNLNDELVVDAARKGSKIRFANHADLSTANLYPRIIASKGDQRIAMCTRRRIQAGEELMFDYAHDHDANWNTESSAPVWFKRATAEEQSQQVAAASGQLPRKGHKLQSQQHHHQQSTSNAARKNILVSRTRKLSRQTTSSSVATFVKHSTLNRNRSLSKQNSSNSNALARFDSSQERHHTSNPAQPSSQVVASSSSSAAAAAITVPTKP